MDSDFSPSKLFTNLIDYWWIVAILTILGGAAGVLVARLHAPLYESKAAITSVIDYAVLGKLGDWEVDQVYTAIGDEIGSSEVKNEVAVKVIGANKGLTENEVLNGLTLQRQDSRWIMYVRLKNANLAQQAAEIWSESAMQALDSMKAKTAANMAAQEYINSLVTCLKQTVVTEANAADCNSQNFNQIQSAIQQVIQDPSTQLAGQSLLLYHTSFQLTSEANLPTSSVLFSQNGCGLAGMLLGLLAGIFLMSLDVKGFSCRKVNPDAKDFR